MARRQARPETIAFTPAHRCCGTCPHWEPPRGGDDFYGACDAFVVVAPIEEYAHRNVANGYPRDEPSLVKRVRHNLVGYPVAVTQKIRDTRIVFVDPAAREKEIYGRSERLRTAGWVVCPEYDGAGTLATGRGRRTFLLVVPDDDRGPEGDDPGEEAFLQPDDARLARSASVPKRSYQLLIEGLS